jgi:phage repressor protein C with HTH and peptisase S24 domain
VEKRHAANVGDMVIAIVDDDFTLKYLDRDKDGFIFRPANPAYQSRISRHQGARLLRNLWRCGGAGEKISLESRQFRRVANFTARR